MKEYLHTIRTVVGVVSAILDVVEAALGDENGSTKETSSGPG